VVVLDDDPTGTQTVHSIPVLTGWSVEVLCKEFANDLPAFYLLTNSRSLLLPESQALHARIGHNLKQAAALTGVDFVVVSRSDSTLRGHFPGEVEALAGALGQDFDAWLLIPFFEEGGRYTIQNVHYVSDGEWLIPAGETPYARDATFGYRSSDLREWVDEKTGGRFPAETVAAISIADIRLGGRAQVTDRLMALPHGSVCIVNAASNRDLVVFAEGLAEAEARGRRFLYRTAASFVPARAGIPPRPLLTCDDLALPAAGGGLFVVGSYVPTTSAQVSNLLEQTNVASLEVHVDQLLSENLRENEIRRVVRQAEEALTKNKTVVIYTSRALITGEGAASSLVIGQTISKGLIQIVRAVSARPRYLLAKGGITSSDVATKGLDVQRAMVRGQILPGVPVWQLGPESRFPGLAYIVFPGNVGGPMALVDLYRTLRHC